MAFEVLWGVTSIQLLAILSETKNLGLQEQILRFAQYGRRVLPHNTSKSQLILEYVPHYGALRLGWLVSELY